MAVTGLQTCNFFVFRRERTEISELPLEYFQRVLLIAVRDGAGAEMIEVATTDKTYKL